MDIEKEKSKTKKWITAYIIIALTMFVCVGAHWLFIFPTITFGSLAFVMFKDFRKLDEEYEPKLTNVQEVVTNNLEEKQINQEVNIKMEKTNEEKTLLLEVLSKDEELNAFVRVENGKVKFALFEKLRAELEVKPADKPKEEKDKEEAVRDSKGEAEDIVMED